MPTGYYRANVFRAEEVRRILKKERFEPMFLGLTDGRSVLIRHPDQVVVAERHVIVGLARMERSRPLETPRTADAIARDWLIINLLHMAAVEPADDAIDGRSRKRPR